MASRTASPYGSKRAGRQKTVALRYSSLSRWRSSTWPRSAIPGAPRASRSRADQEEPGGGDDAADAGERLEQDVAALTFEVVVNEKYGRLRPRRPRRYCRHWIVDPTSHRRDAIGGDPVLVDQVLGDVPAGCEHVGRRAQLLLVGA